ncbi:hypothetical protein BC332_30817 [Capsicum chinense]|nr:hypothetical protein BC332_30817 [Capsicum chinense]
MYVEIKQITSQENPQKLQNNKEAITKDNPHTVAGYTSGSPDSGNYNSSNSDLTFHEDQDEDNGMDDCDDVSNYDDVDDYLSESRCKNDSVPDNASPHSGPSQKCGSAEEGTFHRRFGLENPNGYPNICLILAQYLKEQFPKLYASREKASASTQNQDEAVGCKSLPRFDLSAWLTGGGPQVNIGVGCDHCGMCPMVGERCKCKDCKEKIGAWEMFIMDNCEEFTPKYLEFVKCCEL